MKINAGQVGVFVAPAQCHLPIVSMSLKNGIHLAA
jgi:hypothetical protein